MLASFLYTCSPFTLGRWYCKTRNEQQQVPGEQYVQGITNVWGEPLGKGSPPKVTNTPPLNPVLCGHRRFMNVHAFSFFFLYLDSHPFPLVSSQCRSHLHFVSDFSAAGSHLCLDAQEYNYPSRKDVALSRILKTVL